MCFVFQIYMKKTGFSSFPLLTKGFLFKSKIQEVLTLNPQGCFFFSLRSRAQGYMWQLKSLEPKQSMLSPLSRHQATKGRG